RGHPGWLVGHLRVLGRPRRVVQAGVPVARGQRQQRLDRLRARGKVGPRRTNSGTVRMVRSLGTTVSTSSQVSGVETWPPVRGRANHAPKTVLCGAFWLKSTKT